MYYVPDTGSVKMSKTAPAFKENRVIMIQCDTRKKQMYI